ncbi:DUF4062 domain-containing protein [Blastococcus sp. LR1]|uniref:DUF4062 domain-containing protein n=1 Tax=Blastococcus sp. LR1 TaxID=2877000 RepID=UPI001CC933DD|nr:DUF4062 domain-containing protein [Blastococcus sp. LR1]MCA0144263.1 DUF4062 domain-containing protein [Blastococcus sp. LR1]
MRVFISSVRISLEQERDSLKGLVVALGHEPVMFEDFTAQPVPSREACLEGVRSCDVYLLLLGQRYGYEFPETGLSPTAEEHVAARTAGIPRLVMRKTGVEPEPRQKELIEEIRSYRDGVFYNEFTDVVDLQAKVAAALRQAEQAPGSLTFAPLPGDVPVQWRGEWPAEQQGHSDHAVLELHVLPAASQPVPSRVLRALPERLAAEVRSSGGVGPSASVPADHDTAAAWAHVVERRHNRMYDEVRDGSLLGCRVATTGQTSVWGTLPGDGMGSILDPADLMERLARFLRTAGAAMPGDAQQLALAVGVDPLTSVTEGRVTGMSRSRASGFSLGRERLAVPPDEAVTRAALSNGARDAARTLTEALLTAYRSNNRAGY